MDRRFRATWGLMVVCLAVPASAEVVVTLRAVSLNGNPINGPVPAESTIDVEVLLSAEGADAPLPDVRLIQFDLRASSTSLVVESFTWRLEPGISDSAYLQFATLPTPSATYTATSSTDGLIVDLTTTPVRVAVVRLQVNDDGTLNVVGSVAGGGTSSAQVDAGFSPRESFTLANGLLTGGLLELIVGEGEVPNGNGNDNTNTNTGPRVSSGICGAGLLGSVVFCLAGLIGLSRPRFNGPWR